MEQVVLDAQSLLERKRTLFEDYYEATAAIVAEQDFASIEQYITKRDELANKIDELDVQVRSLLSPWEAELPGLLGGRSAPDELPPALCPLHAVCGQIIDLVRRVRLKNSEALANCESLRDENMKGIKSTANLPKISRYLHNLSEPRGGNNFGKV